MESKEIQIKSSWLKSLEYENSTFTSAFDTQLTQRDLEIAYRELNEREDTKKECIQKLKERLEQDEVILYRTDENYLLRYLRFAKFDCDKAYNSIRKLHNLRINYPECFRLPPDLENLMNRKIFTFLPYKDEEGQILFWFDYRRWRTDEVTFSDLLPLLPAMYDVVSGNPHSHINGVIGIWDCKALTLGHFSQVMRSSLLRTTLSIMQDCYPYRIKCIYLINCNMALKIAYAAVRYLLKKKIVDRLKFLGSDVAELHKYVNPALLPKEYGGTLEQNECKVTGLIMDNLDYLEYERSFGLKSSNNTH